MDAPGQRCLLTLDPHRTPLGVYESSPLGVRGRNTVVPPPVQETLTISKNLELVTAGIYLDEWLVSATPEYAGLEINTSFYIPMDTIYPAGLKGLLRHYESSSTRPNLWGVLSEDPIAEPASENLIIEFPGATFLAIIPPSRSSYLATLSFPISIFKARDETLIPSPPPGNSAPISKPNLVNNHLRLQLSGALVGAGDLAGGTEIQSVYIMLDKQGSYRSILGSAVFNRVLPSEGRWTGRVILYLRSV